MNIPPKKIVVVADTGTETFALQRAVDIATKTSATIVLIGFVYDPAVELGTQLSRTERKKMVDRLVQARLAELDVAVRAQRKHLITIQSQVVWTKRMAVWLCDNVRGLAGDLVVKTSHSSHRPLYVPSDWYLMRELSVPLWLVYPERSRRRNEVLAAIDASNLLDAQHDLNRVVLRISEHWASIWQAHTSVCYVKEVSSLPLDFDIVDEHSYLQKQTKVAKDSLTHELKALKAGTTVIPLAAAGKMTDIFPALVNKRKPQVVVFGTAARRGVSRFFFGNTSENVIPLLECDVLIVKSGHKVTRHKSRVQKST